MNEWKLDPELALVPSRGRQLILGIVDAHRARAAACHPCRDVAGTATELDGVPTLEIVRQHPQGRFRHAPDAPARFGLGPGAPPRLLMLSGPSIHALRLRPTCSGSSLTGDRVRGLPVAA